LFKNDKYEPVQPSDFEDDDLHMTQTLGEEYKAENIKSDVLGDKLKITFTIRDQQTALKCFNDYNKPSYGNKDRRTKIFYLKPGNYTLL
jgi:hypothetical protein